MPGWAVGDWAGLGWGCGSGGAWWLGWGAGVGAGLLSLELDFLGLGLGGRAGFCDWNLVLGWVGLEIEGLGGSTPATTSNFYLFLS